MNAPWFEPTEIDWEDGLNPLAIPSKRPQRNPYQYQSLQHPTLVEIRNADGMTAGARVFPTDAAAAVDPLATVEASIQLTPGTWLIGISGASTQPEGFTAQVIPPSGANMFSQPIHSAELNAKPYYLPKAQGIIAPYRLTVRISNQSASANACQLCLWLVEPE